MVLLCQSVFRRMRLMLTTMLQHTKNWTIDSWRLFKAVVQAPNAIQRRATLVRYARDNNNAAAQSLLRADQEIGLVRYYGLTRYLYEKKILPVVTPRLPLINLPNAAHSSSSTSSSSSSNDGTTAAAAMPTTTIPTTTVVGAKIPFMITTSMRADLEERLLYRPAAIKLMTPVQASLVLRHNLPPERYETEIDALIMKDDMDRNKAAQVKDDNGGNVLLSSALPDDGIDKATPTIATTTRILGNDEDNDNKDNDNESSRLGNNGTSSATTVGGKIWYQVIEQPNHNGQPNNDPYVVGLFLREHEALACQQVHEELAIKKRSQSTFATRAIVKP